MDELGFRRCFPTTVWAGYHQASRYRFGHDGCDHESTAHELLGERVPFRSGGLQEGCKMPGSKLPFDYHLRYFDGEYLDEV